VGAHAQSAPSFPAKPIRLVVPYPPGGGTDTIGRPLAHRLTENLEQQVIVDNRGGAGGNIGMELVAKSPPDGYTLVLALTAQLTDATHMSASTRIFVFTITGYGFIAFVRW
jgi:tripartite-type tricarboxylate transporter receptor subunit TctC